MAKLPRISGKELCNFLEKLGFIKSYGKGSHVKFQHQDGRRTIVPVHGNEDLGPGLLKEILNQLNLSREKFEDLL